MAETTLITGNRGLELRTIEDMARFANGVVKSGLAPASFRTPEAVMIAIQYGAEVGFSPMQALQSIAVINGKPSLFGDALPALAWSSGLLESFNESIVGEGDKRCAVCELKRKGVEQPIVKTFSVADAKQAGLWAKGGPWSQYPERMLTMRARAFAFRDGFADVLRGLAVREEVEDYSVVQQPATGWTMPTKIEQKPMDADDAKTWPNWIKDRKPAEPNENVLCWTVPLEMCQSAAAVEKLYSEFKSARERMTPADVSDVEAAFDSRLKVVP